MLVDKLDLRRDMSRNPLFDTMFILQNMQLQSSEQKINDLSFMHYGIEKNISKFDLTFNTWESNQEIYCNLQYCTRLFKKETMERLVGHFRNIVTQIVENPDRKLMQITMISETEKEDLIFKFNDTKTEYPKYKAIQQIFEEQVDKTPDNIALIFKDQEMTYVELNQRSNQLARRLREYNIGSNQIVGIMVERSFEMAIGILGILKAGGAYLPIDPNYPEERIEYMIADSNFNILLTQSHLRAKTNKVDLVIDLDDTSIYNNESTNLDVLNDPTDLAYIIYTSGSTGKPKGVMVKHINIVNTINWRKAEYNLSSEDRVLQLFSFAFDGFLTSFFTPIVSGSQVVFLSENDIKDVHEIKKQIVEHKITSFISVPALYKQLLECLDSKEMNDLRLVTLAGEKVDISLVQKSKEKQSDLELINEFGVTEASVVSTIARNIEDNEITIGKPIANVQIYICDKYNQIVPVGVIGEICIAGQGVARGYLNRDELTKERFISNPFGLGKLYKTGDYGRWLADGRIEYIGRIDQQVKVRGYRIELGEIENYLRGHNAILDAVVVDLTDNDGNSYLTGYFVSDADISSSEIRKYLGKELPEYMIPAYFIQIESMPLSPNGKVNRKALPKPKDEIVKKDYFAPTNNTEARLAIIWLEILGLDRVGITDDFFQIGGHSLNATSMISKVYKAFNVQIPLREVFKTPTIKALAIYILNAEENIYSSIKKVEDRENYPQGCYLVSSAQKRLYLINQFEEMKTGYNMPSIMKVEGDLDKERFENVINELIRRHDAFRTSFTMIDGEVVQRINDDVEFAIAYLNTEDQMTEKEIIKEFIRPFDLSQAPLLRVGLIKSDDESLLVFDMHHIISDGMSMEILTNEFIRLYSGIGLPELRIQYKDFADWQNDLFNSEIFKKQEKYWLSRFGQDAIPVLNMPTDYPRPALMSFAGETISFGFEKEITAKLNNLANENGETLYMVLLAAYNILLSKYSGQEDIIVGSPIAGRPHPDLSNIIGMFVNTLAMRNMPEGQLTFSEFLNHVKENAIAAYENQDYQFEMLVDKLDLRRDMSRNPLFDTMFVLQNLQMQNMPLQSADQMENNLRFVPYEFENKISKFDLTLNTMELNGELRCNLQYCTKLFKKETMARFIGHFRNIVTQIVEHTDRKLIEISSSTLHVLKAILTG